MSRSVYPYEPGGLAALRKGLSDERFQTYASDATGDADALRKYMWNAAVAARFHGPLHLLEVTLRNSIHERMSGRYGGAWFESLPSLRQAERNAVAKAKDFLTERGESASSGKVVAEVSFRFWVSLFSNGYDPLWKTDLASLFRPRLPRNEVHSDLDKLRTLRNRIAHHEPIFRRALMDDFDRIDKLLHALSPEMADWMRWHERARETYGTLPHEIEAF